MRISSTIASVSLLLASLALHPSSQVSSSQVSAVESMPPCPNNGGDITAASCVYTTPATDPTGQYPFITHKITTTDILFDKNESWTTNPSPDCTTKRDWESTATHEMGHAWGLFDIYGTHDSLTMFGIGSTCTTYRRTLGKGDVRGFKHLYD